MDWTWINIITNLTGAAARENRFSGVPNRPDKNRAAQTQKQSRTLKFRIKEEEELYYPFSENKGADQLRSCSFCEADLRLWFSICRLFVFFLMTRHSNTYFAFISNDLLCPD